MSVGSSYTNISQIKKVGLEILQIIDTLAQPRLKNVAIKKFWNWFFVSHGKNVILHESDANLKQVMKAGYLALRPIYEKADMSNGITEGVSLGSPKPPNIGELKEIMDLIG